MHPESEPLHPDTTSPSFTRWALELSAIGADFARGVVSGEAFFPRQMLLNSMGIAAVSAESFGALWPGATDRTAWMELANKLRAYRLFASAEALDTESLTEAMLRVRSLGPYSSVWAMEGIGYCYAQRGERLPVGDRQELPRHALIPLHSGAGLRLAETALRGVRRSDVAAMSTEFRQRCRQLAQTGFLEVVFEALGLIAITLYPHLVDEIDCELSGSEDELAALFWHGVGRGLYFSPTCLIPFTGIRRRAVDICNTAPSTTMGRENALAGLAWTMTLVNIREPEVIAAWLRQHAEEIGRSDAFVNGVTSALIVWLSAAPEDRYVDLLGQFRPPVHDPAENLWGGIVGRACRNARRLHNGPAAWNVPAKVFRARPLVDLEGSDAWNQHGTRETVSAE
jgi:hypothetical protein